MTYVEKMAQGIDHIGGKSLEMLIEQVVTDTKAACIRAITHELATHYGLTDEWAGYVRRAEVKGNSN